MNYFKVFASNGLCTCEEEWVTSTEKEDLDFYDDVLDLYSYETGYAGMEYDEDDWDEPYEDMIGEYSYWEEITEEEFIYLRDEEGWEER